MSNNTATIKTRKNLVSTRTITMTALLAAISYVLAFLEFPVPLSPSFARMDLSDLPALIGTFAFGPVTGVMIELIKNIFYQSVEYIKQGRINGKINKEVTNEVSYLL